MNTTDGAAPLLRVTLRDGSTLSIAPDVVRVGVTTDDGGRVEGQGAETITLDRVQDARQIAPEPPTFALRVAGRRLLEFQPVDPAEGPLALEALFRLRPDLRPAGFEPPADAPEWWPGAAAAAWVRPRRDWTGSSGLDDARGAAANGGHLAGYGADPRAGVTASYPGAPRDSGSYPVRSPSFGPPRPADPVAAYPRDLLGLVVAVWRLFRAHWRAWLLLGLIVSAPPAILSGALEMAFYAVRGFSPWRGLDTSAIGVWPARPPRPPQLAELIALLVAMFAVELVAGAWQAAVLGVAGSEALRGRPVDVRASLSLGARRFGPTLLATLGAFAAPMLAMSIPAAVAVAAAAPLEGANPNVAPSAAVLAATSVVCLGTVLFAVLAGVGLYVMTRLFVAPYLAATEPLDARSALVASWRLTGGQGRWWQAPGWRALALVAIVWLIELLVTAPLSNVELASYALASLVVNPLSVCVTGPLTSLAFVVALRDLRLRAGGANPHSS